MIYLLWAIAVLVAIWLIGAIKFYFDWSKNSHTGVSSEMGNIGLALAWPWILLIIVFEDYLS